MIKTNINCVLLIDNELKIWDLLRFPNEERWIYLSCRNKYYDTNFMSLNLIVLYFISGYMFILFFDLLF